METISIYEVVNHQPSTRALDELIARANALEQQKVPLQDFKAAAATFDCAKCHGRSVEAHGDLCYYCKREVEQAEKAAKEKASNEANWTALLEKMKTVDPRYELRLSREKEPTITGLCLITDTVRATVYVDSPSSARNRRSSSGKALYVSVDPLTPIPKGSINQFVGHLSVSVGGLEPTKIDKSVRKVVANVDMGIRNHQATLTADFDLVRFIKESFGDATEVQDDYNRDAKGQLVRKGCKLVNFDHLSLMVWPSKSINLRGVRGVVLDVEKTKKLNDFLRTL